MTNDDDKKNFTATAVKKDKEEEKVATADNNSARSSKKNNKATAKSEGESDNQNQSAELNFSSESSKGQAAVASDNTASKAENDNSLSQVRQDAIASIEQFWKNAGLNSSQSEVLGKDWKKGFEGKNQTAINDYQTELKNKITAKWLEEAKKEPEAQSNQQFSSTESDFTKNEPKGDNSSSSVPNSETTKPSSPPKENKFLEAEKAIAETQIQTSEGKKWNSEVFSPQEIKQAAANPKINSAAEIKKIQKALTIAEKSLTSQDFQAGLFIKLRAIKDEGSTIYQATKPQVDRAIQHSQKLFEKREISQQQEQIRARSQKNNQENKENSLTTGQKSAIALGIIGGIILLGVVISQVIKPKKKKSK